jgi:hypothetical protein
MIAAIEPFVQSLLAKATEEEKQEPKQKIQRSQRRLFDAQGTYKLIRRNLMDENVYLQESSRVFFG